MRRSSVGRTMLVAASVAVFCSLVVASAVTYLRPIQLAWAELDRSRLLLELSGLIEEQAGLPEREIATRFRQLEAVLVDLQSGRVDDRYEAMTFDPRASATIAAEGTDIPDDIDLAGLGRRARLAPAYLYYDDGRLQSVILPVWGQGMWAPIQAYIALEADCMTIRAIGILEHGETPGIGDRIERSDWRDSWRGLLVADPSGRVRLKPGKGESVLDAHTFDSISGATVTVTAMGRIVAYWLGPHGFGPFLQRCRAGEVLAS